MNQEPGRQVTFDFSEPDIAELLSNSSTPNGVQVSKPQTVIKASQSGGLFHSISILFRDVSVSLLAAWIYDCFKNGNKKSGHVNNQKIVFSKASIRRLINKQLADQKARDKQWAKEQKKPIRN